ncbi:MAG: hypothetical protein PHO15_00315 [Eubacteriales bacterium]|nr:hypothetical protein [Eubacteriales bacterium]
MGQTLVYIDDSAIAKPKILSRKEIGALLKKGGCPANNTRCLYLKNGMCIFKKPELDYRGGKLGCWSADII